MIEIDISRQAGVWNDDIERLIEKVVQAALPLSGFKAQNAELSIVLADNDFVQELNKNYRGKDKPTNVLSFPQDEEFMLGDIILAYETVQKEAEEQSKSFEDHTTHLVVHGLLHLLGHDHEEDKEAEIMEALEIKILETLEIKNPYETAGFVA